MYQIDCTLRLNLRGSTVNNKGNGDEATKKHEKRRRLENRGSGWRRPYLRRRRRDGEKPSKRSCDAGVRAATLAKHETVKGAPTRGERDAAGGGEYTDGGDRGGVRPYLRSRRCGEERERRRRGGCARTLATFPKRCEEAN
jgi:hypothetical protein